mgnify:FL=1
MKHKIKANDRVLTPSMTFGRVIYTDRTNGDGVALIEIDADNYPIEYKLDALVYIPELEFWNCVLGVDKIKPGCLVQAVDTGHFHHIVRLVTAESGEIYIQTTISDSITHAPEDLTFIG